LQFRAALAGGGVIARSSFALAEDAAGLIADDGGGAGLAAIHA